MNKNGKIALALTGIAAATATAAAATAAGRILVYTTRRIGSLGYGWFTL
jgi:hypothetical protein